MTTASCDCGQLKLHIEGQIEKSSICHCTSCQKRTGSNYGVQTVIEYERVQVTGESKMYRRKADSGNEVQFHFCPNCGSTVYWQLPEYFGDKYCVALGNLDATEIPAPTFSVYKDRMPKWYRPPDSIETHWN